MDMLKLAGMRQEGHLGDRYIPLRANSKLDLVCYQQKSQKDQIEQLDQENCEDKAIKTRDLILDSYLKSELLGYSLDDFCLGTGFRSNIFKFKPPANRRSRGILKSLFNDEEKASLKIERMLSLKQSRKVCPTPFKVLDAPGIKDDFYLNLLDWSETNLLSVALSSSVYLWNANNGKVSKICDLQDEGIVTSVTWNHRGSHLAVGSGEGKVHIWDVRKAKEIREFEGHADRVGSLAWGRTCLASGSKDKTILMRDTRCKQKFHQRLIFHQQEVCGLKWSHDDQKLGSGGNDNKLAIWTSQFPEPIFSTSEHRAAVKALAWSPHQHGILASGGGTDDRCIRFWNVNEGKRVKIIDTGSQVCSLAFCKNVKELVSTHGFTKDKVGSSSNQVKLWSYPDMKNITSLNGHTYRVLYLAMSPDSKTIVTGAGDETLRFWRLFPEDGKKKSSWGELDFFGTSSTMIR